jgi:phage-related protein
MSEVFSWDPLVEPTGEEKFRTRSAQFGDGYKQLAQDGLNSSSQRWPLTFGGQEDEIEPIVSFLRRHAGAKSFLWRPPLGVQSLWTCAGFNTTPHVDGLYTVTATFEQSFQP